MSRLRQINSQNYHTSPHINDEFESLVRYINSAEVGNKTLAELMAILFDAEGNFDAAVELRLDSEHGLQYRTGEHATAETGWVTIAEIDAVRGAPGANFGSVGAPIFESRFDYEAAGGETELDLAHEASAIFMVFKNGLLLSSPADYTTSPTGGSENNGSVLFSAALVLSDNITVYKIQSVASTTIQRYDYETISTQTNFAAIQRPQDNLQVFKNGVLMTEGVLNDYYRDIDNDLVIFTVPVPSSTKVAIFVYQPSDDRPVAGLMLEADYTWLSGLIRFDKLAINDGQIPQSKIASLVQALSVVPDIAIGSSTPDPIRRFWLDTSVMPNQLKFYDGTRYLSANPATALPTFNDDNANQVLIVDASGTRLIFSDIDLSSLVPKTQRGAANGVATLDSAARLPVAQLPEYSAYDTINTYIAGSVTDGSKRGKRLFKQQLQITAIDFRSDGGTCDIQITVDGSAVGATYNVSVTPGSATLATPITVDASSSSKLVGVLVSNAAAPVNLDVAITVKVKSQ